MGFAHNISNRVTDRHVSFFLKVFWLCTQTMVFRMFAQCGHSATLLLSLAVRLLSFLPFSGNCIITMKKSHIPHLICVLGSY